MKTLTYVLKRKDEAGKVLSFVSGVNDAADEGQDLAGFVSPYYEDGQVLLYEGDKLIFDSQKVDAPFFELNVLVKGFTEAKAVFLVDPKGKKIKEITSAVSSIAPKKDEEEKTVDEKMASLKEILTKEECVYLTIDLSLKINREHLEAIKDAFYRYEIPVLLLSDEKKRKVPLPPVERHKRAISVRDTFNLKSFLNREWPTACFLVLFPFIGSLSLTISGALFGEGETTIGVLLLLLSFFVYGMHVYISQSLFQLYPTRHGMLAGFITSFASSFIGAILAILVSLGLSNWLDVAPFIDLMAYSYLAVIIMMISSIVIGIWAFVKTGLPSIFIKKVKKGK